MADKNKQKMYFFSEERLSELREKYKSFDDDEKCDKDYEGNEGEADEALFLIDQGLIEPNVFSSRDWIQEIQARLRDVENSPSILSDLVELAYILEFRPTNQSTTLEANHVQGSASIEEISCLNGAWNQLYKDSDTIFDDKSLRELTNNISQNNNLTSVEAFLEEVYSGRLPTPELLLSVAKSFQLYFLAEGRLTLEDVFFGKVKKKSGSYANQYVKERTYLFFHDTTLREKCYLAALNKPKESLEKSAEKFLTNNHLDEDGNIKYFDVDVFLRGYRRWKKKNGI